MPFQLDSTQSHSAWPCKWAPVKPKDYQLYHNTQSTNDIFAYTYNNVFLFAVSCKTIFPSFQPPHIQIMEGSLMVLNNLPSVDRVSPCWYIADKHDT